MYKVINFKIFKNFIIIILLCILSYTLWSNEFIIYLLYFGCRRSDYIMDDISDNYHQHTLENYFNNIISNYVLSQSTTKYYYERIYFGNAG